MAAARIDRSFTVFLIAGEESGDQLGAGLMCALSRRLGQDVRFVGIGGERMAGLGLDSLFPMEEVSHAGFVAVIANLRRILARIEDATRAVIAADPDILILIDCPGFNLRVGSRVRRLRPSIKIVDYVSPSVWAWHPSRARWMAKFVDQILAILPFEPDVHRRLGGPPCTYVGHPLLERLPELRPAPGERAPIARDGRLRLLVLPGSRRGEIKRLMPPFGETVARVADQHGPIDVVLPAVSYLADEIKSCSADWAVQPTIVDGEAAKFAAFRCADAALAASGTVTLELALSGVPMVVAYRVDPLVKPFKFVLARINSFVLPNLITGENAIPEFLDRGSTPDRLAAALLPLLGESPERSRQLQSFARLESVMALDSGRPNDRATDMVLRTAGRGAG